MVNLLVMLLLRDDGKIPVSFKPLKAFVSIFVLTFIRLTLMTFSVCLSLSHSPFLSVTKQMEWGLMAFKIPLLPSFTFITD